MTKRIRLCFPEEGVTAFAKVLEDEAPRTCQFIWEHLPVDGRTLHGMYSGRCIYVPVNPPAPVPPENQVNMSLPGDICYFYQKGGVYRGVSQPYAEIEVVYGRDVQHHGDGHLPIFVNLFARFVGNWTAFAEICQKTRYEGPALLRVERANDQ